MKKLFILFLLMLFAIGIVHAESNDSGGDDGGSGDSGSDDDTPECTVDSDCSSDGVCIAGECKDLVDDSGNDDMECSVDADCFDGRLCIDGDCEDVEDETDDFEDDSDMNETEDVEDDSNNGLRPENCIDSSALRNMNDLELKIRRAEQAGESQRVDELKTKLKELALKIRERTEECNRLRPNLGEFVSDAAKLKDGSAAGIVDYYKAKLSEISMEDNQETRLDMLRALRSEVDSEIKTIMESKRQIRSDDIKDLVEKIEIKSDKIRADDVEIDSADKSILTEVNGKEVEIKVSNGQVKIIVDGVEADTSEITIENDTLFYNGIAVKTLPSVALLRYKLKVKEMELEQKEDRLVYKIKYEENRKILGMFKARSEHNAEIDVDDGNKVDDKGSWWQWLSTRDGSAETETTG
jgi:hypothetical protein